MEEILLKIFKSKHNQGDTYYCYKSKKRNWIVGYKNDYPMQHGIGVEWVIPEEVAEILVSQVESLIVPKIAEGFKVKYRGKEYKKAAIKSDGTIKIYSDDGNIYTSFNKCEIIQ